MTRVAVIVEGQTEESFIKDVLAPTLWSRNVFLTPILLGVPGHKGGRPNYARVRKDVLLYLKQDRSAYCATMLDFYGLGQGFPGTPVPHHLPSLAKVSQIECAIKEDVCGAIPELQPDIRFLPYLQLHEFEGLLFSHPPNFAAGINQAHLATTFQSIRNEFPTPEDINNSPATAPSKRVLNAYPSYRKVIHGTAGANAVGIVAMREECPHFRAWLEHMEGLGAQSA